MSDAHANLHLDAVLNAGSTQNLSEKSQGTGILPKKIFLVFLIGTIETPLSSFNT